jgi:hypothetical protein
MTNLRPVKIGWIGKTINALIDAINARTISVPLGGGLDIQETQSGVMLSLSKNSANNPANVGWQSINVIDDSSGVCVTKTITYWGTPPA